MSQVHDDILMITKASAITNIELIQPLWNNYGTLSRVSLRGGTRRSVIMKHIQLPERRGHLQSHPRGFGSARSRQRKITSYHVEMRWYDHYNARLPKSAPTPRCLGSFTEGDELCLILEDLAERGFDRVVERASRREIELVISWLASFHARFMRVEPEGLWSQGTYWHLDTRPDELAEIKGSRVHRFASFIDARLRRCEFQTLVHGDAKLANFCFSSDHASVDLDMSAGVAAVDFQYVGRGCGMSDLAYFLGSCLSEPECQALEEELLELYFAELRAQLTSDLSAELTVEETSCLTDLNRLDMDALEAKWRALYPAAWADFQRFLLGWSPSHHKLTTYSDTLTTATIDEIRDELLSAARSACLAAGELISSYQERVFTVSSKGFASAAGDVLTEVDIRAQELILEQLAPSIRAYDLGILAEEGEQDRSRLEKHAFWTIDPLDGTQ